MSEQSYIVLVTDFCFNPVTLSSWAAVWQNDILYENLGSSLNSYMQKT